MELQSVTRPKPGHRFVGVSSGCYKWSYPLKNSFSPAPQKKDTKNSERPTPGIFIGNLGKLMGDFSKWKLASATCGLSFYTWKTLSIPGEGNFTYVTRIIIQLALEVESQSTSAAHCYKSCWPLSFWRLLKKSNIRIWFTSHFAATSR